MGCTLEKSKLDVNSPTKTENISLPEACPVIHFLYDGDDYKNT